MHGTLATVALRFDPSTHQFQFIDKPFGGLSLEGTSAVMSSALMLYRLLCVFGEVPLLPPVGQAYKSIWAYPLRHRATGEYLTLLDYKAGWTINTSFTEPDQLPHSFAEALFALLNFPMSDAVVHPYDGTVAGSVA